MRSMQDISRTVKVNERYDLTAQNMIDLFEIGKKDMFEALSICFKVGYERGRKATLKEIK